MITRHIAIDPGVGGAIALLIEGEYGDVASMPTTMKKSGRREVDVDGLIEIFDRFAPLHNDDRIYTIIERVSAMPGQGVSSMFSLGDSFGVARAVASRYSYMVDFVSPVTWKKKMGLSKDKLYSLTLARRYFPAARNMLARKLDEGRAEALLLAAFASSHFAPFQR